MIDTRDQEPAVFRSFLVASLAFACLGALWGAALLRHGPDRPVELGWIDGSDRNRSA